MSRLNLSRDQGAAVLSAEVVALAGGGVIALAFAALSKGGPYWGDGLQLVGYMLGATVLASVLGLIFAVPRAREDDGAPTTERFLANSNLEQISDWLTKILVGAGLVQLVALPGAMARLGSYLGTDLQVQNAPAMSVAFSVYGVGIGFMFTYLWARLRLRVLLEQSERQAQEQSRTKEIVEEALLRANRAAEAPEPERAVRAAAASAAGLAVQRGSVATHGRLLWVDDIPTNNTSIVAALRELGIQVELARSTNEAMERLGTQGYGLVITDLAREEAAERNDNAGLELIERMRSGGVQTPVIVFSGRGAIARRDEVLGAGAILCTNRASEVFNKAVEILVGRG